MRKFFSEELLAEIHIKLDKQGLDGLSEKEIMVLHQEAIVDSTGQLSAKIDGAVKEIGIKIDDAIVPVHQELRHLRLWSKIVAAGIWAVVASLIASLILKLLVG